MVHGVMSGEAVVKEQGFKSVFFPKKIAPEVQAMLEGDWVSSGEGFMAWWRLADQSREFWVETPSELTRVHVTPRKHLFVPSRWSTQHSALKQNLLETLGGTRTTDFLPCLCDGVVLQQRTDQWKLPCEELRVDCGSAAAGSPRRARTCKPDPCRLPVLLSMAAPLPSVWKMVKSDILGELRSYGVPCHDTWLLPELRTILQEQRRARAPPAEVDAMKGISKMTLGELITKCQENKISMPSNPHGGP